MGRRAAMEGARNGESARVDAWDSARLRTWTGSGAMIPRMQRGLLTIRSASGCVGWCEKSDFGADDTEHAPRELGRICSAGVMDGKSLPRADILERCFLPWQDADSLRRRFLGLSLLRRLLIQPLTDTSYVSPQILTRNFINSFHNCHMNRWSQHTSSNASCIL